MCELFAEGAMRTGTIPLGNTSGRPAIPPAKQILAFLWSMGNQEPARAVVDRFNIRELKIQTFSGRRRRDNPGRLGQRLPFSRHI